MKKLFTIFLIFLSAILYAQDNVGKRFIKEYCTKHPTSVNLITNDFNLAAYYITETAPQKTGHIPSVKEIELKNNTNYSIHANDLIGGLVEAGCNLISYYWIERKN